MAYDVIAAGNAGDLGTDGEYYVLIVANVPIGALDGQFDDFVVAATATNAGTASVVVEDRTQGLEGVNTVFADDASASTRTGDQINAALNGADADETRLVLTAPVVLATKIAVVLDEGLPGSTFSCTAGGAATGAPLAAIPGACVEYTISVENTSPSGTEATDISITDVLPDNITFAGLTAGAFDAAETGGTVTATLATLPAGTTQSFTIRATVD